VSRFGGAVIIDAMVDQAQQARDTRALVLRALRRGLATKPGVLLKKRNARPASVGQLESATR
jgi:hypothetical protein